MVIGPFVSEKQAILTCIFGLELALENKHLNNLIKRIGVESQEWTINLQLNKISKNQWDT